MNTQALIQDRYSLLDFEQIVGFIEHLLSVYSGAVFALFVFIVAIAACRAILDSRRLKESERPGTGSHHKTAPQKSSDHLLCRSGFERDCLSRDSVY